MKFLLIAILSVFCFSQSQQDYDLITAKFVKNYNDLKFNESYDFFGPEFKKQFKQD